MVLYCGCYREASVHQIWTFFHTKADLIGLLASVGTQEILVQITIMNIIVLRPCDYHCATCFL